MAQNQDRLVGRRILVVGASAGIGRVIGRTLCEAGAHVAFAARRTELCQAAAREAAGTAIGLTCDVTVEEQCQRVVDDTVAGLGGLDDLVYSTGLIAMVALAAADASWWRRALETNVVGASLVTRAALPHLKRSRGTAVYLSSQSSSGPAWPGVGVYTASKAALDRMIETWRVEHPEVGFTRIGVGPTDESATGVEVDASIAEHVVRWAELGVHSGTLARPASVAAAVMLVLGDPARISDVSVRPVDGPLPWGTDAAEGRADPLLALADGEHAQ